jgi:prepilin-type N-terminal cleavage/methylation domain-containing protein
MRGTEHRTGFSLIELMVVMGIIAILLAIAAGVYTKFAGVQQNSNTKTQITKIHSLLQKRWNAEIQAARNDAKAGRIPPSVLALAGNDTHRAEVIYVKLRLRQAFPMSFAEAILPLNAYFSELGSDQELKNGHLWPLPEFVKYVQQNLGNTLIVDPRFLPQPCESAACLLLALQRGTGGSVDAEDLGSAAVRTGNADVVGDLMNYNIKIKVNGQDVIKSFPVTGLIDGSGAPLAFCRWPTGSSELNPITAKTPNGYQPGLKNDPGDPEGRLVMVNWRGASTAIPPWRNKVTGAVRTAFADVFMDLCHQLPPANATNPQSYKLQPLVASPGPDKLLGLDWKSFGTINPNFLIPTYQGWPLNPLLAAKDVLGTPTNANDNFYSTSVP